MRRLVVLLVIVLLAGCVQEESPGEGSPDDAPSAGEPADGENETGRMGVGSLRPDSFVKRWSNDTLHTELTDVDTPNAGSQFEGANGLVLFSSEARDSFTGKPFNGTVDHVFEGHLMVSWQATHPLLEELSFVRANGQPGQQEAVTGNSPLSLDLEEFDVDQVFRFYVKPTTPVSVQFRQPLDFEWSLAYGGDEELRFGTCGCG